MGSETSTVPDLSVSNEFETNELGVEDWEMLDKIQCNVTISSSLKKLSNVTKKLTSSLILKDMLGEDGDGAMCNVKTSH